MRPFLPTTLLQMMSNKGGVKEMGRSFGFSPAGYNQIIIFTDEADFKKSVSANPGMAVIIQDNRHGIYVAGVLKAGAS